MKATVHGQQPIRKLFSKEQRAFYEAHAPEGIALDDLATLGPLFVLKLNFVPEGLAGRRLVAEMWLYPDGSRILELSTKCLPGQGLDVAREVKAYLTECGVDLGGEQAPRPRPRSTFFSNELLAAATA